MKTLLVILAIALIVLFLYKQNVIVPPEQPIQDTEIIDAGPANPELWEEFYTKPVKIEKLDTAYDLRQPKTDLEIGKAIQYLHKRMGDDISGYEIVTGLGSSHVLTCIIYALSRCIKNAHFWGQVPSYELHREICDSLKVPWDGKDDSSLVEIVTSPNNPTGDLTYPVSKSKYIIFDAVQAYPCYGYLPGKQKIDRLNIIVYSYSKGLGLASSRVGYALVSKEWLEALPEFMGHYRAISKIFSLGQAVPTERIASALSYLPSKELEVYKTLQQRYDIMSKIVTPMFEIKSKRGMPYIFLYKKDFETSKFFEDMGIEIRRGKVFAVSEEYVRISMYQSTRNFNRLVQRISSKIK